MQRMLHPGPISTNAEEQLWQKNCHRLYLQHWVQWREVLGISRKVQLWIDPLQIGIQPSRLLRKVTKTAPLLVKETKGKVVTDSAWNCLKQKMKTQGSRPATLHADTMKRISLHLLLATWQGWLQGRGFITASEIQSLSLFPWADIHMKSLKCLKKYFWIYSWCEVVSGQSWQKRIQTT